MHSYWLLVCIVLRYCSRYAYWNSPPRLMRYLPRSRSVPTSLYDLSMMYSTNRGTHQYSPFNQINTVTHMLLGNTKHVLFEALLTTGETHSGHLAWNDQILEVLNRWRTNSWGALYTSVIFCISFYSMHFSIVDWVCCISEHSTLIKRQVIPGAAGGLNPTENKHGRWLEHDGACNSQGLTAHVQIHRQPASNLFSMQCKMPSSELRVQSNGYEFLKTFKHLQTSRHQHGTKKMKKVISTANEEKDIHFVPSRRTTQIEAVHVSRRCVSNVDISSIFKAEIWMAWPGYLT